MDEQERYQMTTNGIAIREQYTVMLISASEAIEMAKWLLRHYVQLEHIRRKQDVEQKGNK